MQEIPRNEMVAWLQAIPTTMSCLAAAAPDPPRNVLLALLERGWVTYARDGRVVRSDEGQAIADAGGAGSW